jgi:predicted DCC family thiol-disulfide oxidoreductase YuxK
VSAPESFPGLCVSPPDPRGVLVYDGDCGLCTWCAAHAGPIGTNTLVEALLWLPEQAACTGLEQVLWIDPRGEVWGGRMAIAQMWRDTRRPVWAWLIDNPLTRRLGRFVYRQIATHRRRLSCRICR